MVKNICLLSIVFLLSGCKLFPTKTNYVSVYKPILVCPEPPNIDRPNLMIDKLTENDQSNPGKVVNYYKASIAQLQFYANKLELILKQYDKTSKEYEKLKEEMETWEKTNK